MRKFTDSDIFQKMNTGNGITNQLQIALRAVDEKTIINKYLEDALNTMNKVYRDSLTTQVIEAVHSGRILIVALPIDKVFPASMPYLKTKYNGKDHVVVDLSRYCTITRDDSNNIEGIKIDIGKLYAVLVPAFMALEVLNENTVISSETAKYLALLWAKMFNKILMSQKIFVGTSERYEAFMYFAMRFFLIYYMQIPLPIVDNLSNQYINGAKSKYIMTIESNLKHKNINLYADWNTFAYTMFSDEITNIRAVTNVNMNVDQYLRLFHTYMGRDGAFLSLWSADYAFYCFFVTWMHVWILNDRSFADIVDDDPKMLPKILRGLCKEI